MYVIRLNHVNHLEPKGGEELPEILGQDDDAPGPVSKMGKNIYQVVWTKGDAEYLLHREQTADVVCVADMLTQRFRRSNSEADPA